MAGDNRSFRDRLGDFGHDLMNIETNTILKDGISARKAPALPHALLDVIEKYWSFLLLDVKVDLGTIWEKGEVERKNWTPVFGPPPDSFPGDRQIDNGWDSFDKLRWCAKKVLDHFVEARDEGVLDETKVILYRIRRSSDQIKGILQQMHDEKHPWARLVSEKGERWKTGRTRSWLNCCLAAELKGGEKRKTPQPEHLIAVRKIWEIGVESVQMQTVVQIDGDIVTRIRRSLTKEELERIVPLHQEMVETGVKHWTTMFELVTRLVGDLGKALFRKNQ